MFQIGCSHMHQITERQRSILAYIQRYLAEHGYPPGFRNICNEFGFKSSNAANSHLLGLEKKGYIARDARISRGIRVLRGVDQ
jgi:repressor LexA